MGLLSRLRVNAARVLLPRNQVITTSQQLSDFFRRGEHAEHEGPAVTMSRAAKFAAVYACVRVLSEDIASLPLPLYKRLPRGKERVTDHWVFRLLQQPNKWQTGFEFRELQQTHLEYCGNFFALKTVLKSGEITELLPMAPDRVQVSQATHASPLVYRVTFSTGAALDVPEDRMYHVRGQSLDGIIGASPLELHRQSINFGSQLVTYGNKLFKNGAMPGGVITHPGELGDKALEHLRESFDEKYSGVDNAAKTMILEEGMSFTATGMKAIDAEFLASRKFNRTELAGVYRIPPHLIGDLERATFSNIEEQARGYVQYGILPRIRRIEARANLSLLPLAMRADYFVEHLVDGMLRGNTQARYAAYQSAIASGWMKRNEARELENLPIDDLTLDEYLNPAFLTGSQGPSTTPESGSDAPPASNRLALL